MDEQQDLNFRRQAAQIFFQSIEQLQDTLNEPPADNAKTPQPSIEANSAKKNQKLFDLTELEQAVADIEEFLSSRNAGS